MVKIDAKIIMLTSIILLLLMSVTHNYTQVVQVTAFVYDALKFYAIIQWIHSVKNY